MPGGLSASRWAPSNIAPLTSWPRPRPRPSSSSVIAPPRPPPPSSSPLGASSSTPSRPSPEQELSRFLKIVARLNWKLPFLNHGYAIATDRSNHDRSSQLVDADGIMFKLDFHEFYMLIERALVHLMGVYGIEVFGQHPPPTTTTATSSSSTSPQKPGAPRARIVDGGAQQHRYHANVLAALDDPTNPLHAVFGADADVRRQLQRAKELRNRWKNADYAPEEQQQPQPQPHLHKGNGKRITGAAPLESYNLELMLQTLFAAFDRAYALADRHVRELVKSRAAAQGGSDTGMALDIEDGGPVSAADWSTEVDDWEFMVDAMDWEAV
ncbi:hypothetical protein F4780DRAFT_116216 [Xylariomycetidae sp. FL0641]|nr:hypothetical protein F4780DRAFT_116216 [Xylariomycetidae sp. FL0641]